MEGTSFCLWSIPQSVSNVCYSLRVSGKLSTHTCTYVCSTTCYVHFLAAGWYGLSHNIFLRYSGKRSTYCLHLIVHVHVEICDNWHLAIPATTEFPQVIYKSWTRLASLRTRDQPRYKPVYHANLDWKRRLYIGIPFHVFQNRATKLNTFAP
jgi:hypothetical protein